VLIIRALLTAALAAVPAADQVSQAVDSLSSGPGVYVAAGAQGHPLSQADVDALTQTVQSATSPIFVAALDVPTVSEADTDLRALIDGVHREGTYVVVANAGFRVASDVPGVEGRTAELAQQAIAAHRGQPLAELTDFVQRVEDAAASTGGTGQGQPVAVPAPGNGSRHTSTWVPLLVLGVVGVGLFALIRGGNRRRRAADAAALAEVRAAAEEDVTALGEQLTALDVPPPSAPEAGEDYRAALDAYDRAKATLSAAQHPDDLRPVTSALEEGRWRLACVRAGLAGEPRPERRPPCFFNPQHGPSATDVDWAPRGGAPRPVPVCAADADRLEHGHEPDERMVGVGGTRMPYWQAPMYYGPYAGGFFGGWGGGSFLSGLLVGEMLGGPGMGWGAYDPYYDAGAYNDYGSNAVGGGDFAGQFDIGGGGGGGFDSGGGGWDGGGGGGGFDSGGGGSW
jgi:hypothetical protein